MRSLTVEARSRESADALYDALAGFHRELLGNDDDGYIVRVDLVHSDREMIAVLDAIERHVAERSSPARVELDGRRYNLCSEEQHRSSMSDGTLREQPLICVECGTTSPLEAKEWRGYLTVHSEVVMFCPACVQREFLGT